MGRFAPVSGAIRPSQWGDSPQSVGRFAPGGEAIRPTLQPAHDLNREPRTNREFRARTDTSARTNQRREVPLLHAPARPRHALRAAVRDSLGIIWSAPETPLGRAPCDALPSVRSRVPRTAQVSDRGDGGTSSSRRRPGPRRPWRRWRVRGRLRDENRCC